MALVYLSLGSNLGDRIFNLQQAVNLLDDHSSLKVKRISHLYETEPIGLKEQPEFANGVVEIETSLEPLDLLQSLKDIEMKMGRKTSEISWGPRIIDLDIILYDQLIYDHPELTIPHKEALKRKFVLVPLCDLAPDVLFPGKGLTAEQALESQVLSGKMKKLAHKLSVI